MVLKNENRPIDKKKRKISIEGERIVIKIVLHELSPMVAELPWFSGIKGLVNICILSWYFYAIVKL